MRRNAIIVGVLLFALSWVGLATAQSQSVEPLPYVYRIDIKGCTFEPVNRRQSGFRVQGLVGIVTALHGVADCKTISAVTDNGQELYTDLEIQQVDIVRDVALLGSPELDALPTDGLVSVSLSTTEILTSTLRVVGYPLGLDKQDTDVIESIRALESLDDVIPDAEEPADFIKRKSPSLTIDVLNLQAQLLPGHSGAPVIDPNDQLIAVGSGGLRGGTVGRSWAIPWQDVTLQAVGDVKSQLDALAAKDLAGLAFSSTYPGQVDTTTASATYTVQIIDANQNQPIANAEVLLTHSAGYEIGVTDSKGFHTFHLSTDDTIDYGQSQLQVEAAGYESYSRALSNVLARVSPEKLRLTALRPTAMMSSTNPLRCPFGFRIITPDQTPIRGAHVSVIYHLDVVEAYTNSDGEYWGELPCDKQNPRVDVEVSAPGYALVEKSFLLYNMLIKIQLHALTTATATSVAAVTATPTAKPTPTITPQPATILFHDDFAHGIDPAWQQAEAITTVNGKLTLTYRAEVDWIQGSILSEASDWHQYRLIVDLNQQGFFYEEMRRETQLFVHYQDENNFLALIFSDAFDERPPAWFIVQDGMWIEHKFAQAFYPSQSQLQIEIEVDNDTIVTYFDNKVIDLWTEAPFATGAVGVLLKTKGVEAPWLDDFVMEALNTDLPTPTATATLTVPPSPTATVGLRVLDEGLTENTYIIEGEQISAFGVGDDLVVYGEPNPGTEVTIALLKVIGKSPNSLTVQAILKHPDVEIRTNMRVDGKLDHLSESQLIPVFDYVVGYLLRPTRIRLRPGHELTVGVQVQALEYERIGGEIIDALRTDTILQITDLGASNIVAVVELISGTWPMTGTVVALVEVPTATTTFESTPPPTITPQPTATAVPTLTYPCEAKIYSESGSTKLNIALRKNPRLSGGAYIRQFSSGATVYVYDEYGDIDKWYLIYDTTNIRIDWISSKYLSSACLK